MLKLMDEESWKQLISSCLLRLNPSSTHRSSSPCGLQSPPPDGVKRGHLWPQCSQSTGSRSLLPLLSISVYDSVLCVALLFLTSFTSISLFCLLSIFSQTPTTFGFNNTLPPSYSTLSCKCLFFSLFHLVLIFSPILSPFYFLFGV